MTNKKLLVVSDIHGSISTANKIIDILKKTGADKLVILGDLYYHGIRNPLAEEYNPMAVANLLNLYKDKLFVIKGNCDSEVDEMVSEFKFFNAMTIDFDNITLTFTHGHKYNIDNLPKNCGDVLIYGHTHKTFIKKLDDKIVINVGSITFPKAEDAQDYLILEKNKATLFNLNDEVISTVALKEKK